MSWRFCLLLHSNILFLTWTHCQRFPDLIVKIHTDLCHHWLVFLPVETFLNTVKRGFRKQKVFAIHPQIWTLWGWQRLTSSHLWAAVLGLARTGLIFTGLQEGAQPGGGGWPHLAKQSPVFHAMCRHAGFRWGGAARRERCRGLGGRGASAVRESGCLGRTVRCCVFSLFVSLLFLFPSVCCSVKLPLSRPTGSCLFLFILLRTPAGGGAAAWRFCCRRQPKPKQPVKYFLWRVRVSNYEEAGCSVATTFGVTELVNLRSFQIPLLQFLTFSESN